MATELELSDGTILEIPDDAAPEAIRNYAARGEAMLKQQRMQKGYGNPAEDMASAGLSGVNKGIAEAAGGPVDLVNWGMRKVGLPASDRPVMGSDWIKDRMTGADMIQPSRGHDTAERFGELVGNGVATATGAGMLGPLAQAGSKTAAVLDALGPAKTATGTLAQQTTGAALQQAGETAGGAVGERIGGERGRQIGSVVGGVATPLAPTLAARTGEGALRFALGDGENSARAYDTLQANGITPTPGLVGNQTAARMENAASYIPGGRGERGIMGSFQQFQDRVGQLRGEVAGDPDPRTDLRGADTIGADARTIAERGLLNTKNRIGGEYDQLRDDFGPQRLVPVHEAVDTLRDMGTTTVNGQTRPRLDPNMQAGLDSEIDRVNDIRVPRSQTAEQLLQTEIRARQDMLNDPTLRPNARRQLQQELADLQGRVEANRQVPAEALDKTITKIGYDGQGNPTVDTAQTNQIKNVLKDARLRAYEARDPALADRLRSIDEEYALLMDKTAPRAEGGDIPFLKKLTETPNDIDVFNQVADPKRWDNAHVVMRNDPHSWGSLAADIMGEKSALPPQKRTELINTSPGKFMEWWGTLPTSGKIMYANGSQETLDRINSLYDAAQRFGARSGTMNFSNTAPSAATATFMGTALAHPIAMAKALGSSYLTGHVATSPKTARVLAGKTDPILDRLFAPGAKAGVRALETGSGQ